MFHRRPTGTGDPMAVGFLPCWVHLSYLLENCNGEHMKVGGHGGPSAQFPTCPLIHAASSCETSSRPHEGSPTAPLSPTRASYLGYCRSEELPAPVSCGLKCVAFTRPRESGVSEGRGCEFSRLFLPKAWWCTQHPGGAQ